MAGAVMCARPCACGTRIALCETRGPPRSRLGMERTRPAGWSELKVEPLPRSRKRTCYPIPNSVRQQEEAPWAPIPPPAGGQLRASSETIATANPRSPQAAGRPWRRAGGDGNGGARMPVPLGL